MYRQEKSRKKRAGLTGRSDLMRAAFIPLVSLLMAGGTASAQSGPVRSMVAVPASLVPLDPPQVFGPDTLFEKIDGQAELYLSAGFVHLTSQWFAEAENRDSMFEVYLYDMGDGLNAFSVFSAQRREDAQKVDLSKFAYRTGNSLHLVHGPYYMEMFLAAPSKTALQQMTLLARNFINHTPADPASLDVFGLFPEENLDRDAVSLIAGNAFGFSGLDRVFTAAYTMGGDKVTAFVSKRENAQKAKDLLQGFYAYFLTFGGKDAPPGVDIENAKMVEIMDTYDMMFPVNSYLAGVHAAPTKKQAEQLAESLYRTLRGLPQAGSR